MKIEWAKLLFTPFIYLLAAAVAAYLVWLFRFRLRALIGYLGIKGLKVAGLEISLSSDEIDKARINRQASIAEEEIDDGYDLAAFAAMAAPYVLGRRVLWVDDNPAGNTLERRAFRFLGIQVVNCLSTVETLKELCRDDYDLVISDIGRKFDGENPCAEFRSAFDDDDGFLTLSAINRRWGVGSIPVIFYHGSPSEHGERDDRARREGAIGATTSPSVLYQWALSALLYQLAKENEKLRPLLLLIPRDLKQFKRF